MFRECLEMDDEEVSFIVAADEVGDLVEDSSDMGVERKRQREGKKGVCEREYKRYWSL